MHPDDSARLTWIFASVAAIFIVITYSIGCDHHNIEDGDYVAVDDLGITSATVVDQERRNTTGSRRGGQGGGSGSSVWLQVREYNGDTHWVRRSECREVSVPPRATPGHIEIVEVIHNEEPAVGSSFVELEGLIEGEMRRMQGLPEPTEPILSIVNGMQMVSIEEREKADGGVVYVIQFLMGESPAMLVIEDTQVVEFLRERTDASITISEIEDNDE